MKKLSHVDSKGRADMVDVTAKKIQYRSARAEGFIRLQSSTIALIKRNKMIKGDVLTVAEIAGIQAGKKTSDLIPLCHPLQITKLDVKCEIIKQGVRVKSFAKCVGQTGIEMEALTAVSAALLTVYDMCKAVDKKMKIEKIRLIEKIKSDDDI
ncbi:MAG: cyclic pyranopterin monophosphate synthase MoaC [Melioribacteraceae bacterium]